MNTQLTLPGIGGSGTTGRIARVLLDTPVPHLGRPFDYLIPDGWDIEVGHRVQVRLAGRVTAGYVVETADSSEYSSLRPLSKKISDIPVLTAETVRLTEEVAAHYGGSHSDVVRLAVPPRHARAERDAVYVPLDFPKTSHSGGWENYAGGPAFLRRLAEGDSPRAVWTALPGIRDGVPVWLKDLAAPVQATLASGRRVLIVVPQARDIDLVTRVLHEIAPIQEYRADMDHAERYAAFLAAMHGRAPIIVGTRSAAYLPIADLGLSILWDADSDLLQERHAPYPHTLHVISHRKLGAVLIGSLSRPVSTQHLVETGFAVSVAANRPTLRALAPRTMAPAPEDLHGDIRRIPSRAFQELRESLTRGPVLISVPRAGDLTTRGSERTHVEVMRGFPGIPVTLSNARVGISRTIGPEPRIVVATPGSEPIPESGYEAVVIVDAASSTARADLGASSEVLARWLGALSLAKSATDGGVGIILGGPDPALAQACVRWDPIGWASRQLPERDQLHLPPMWRVARIDGPVTALRSIQRSIEQEGWETIWPEDNTLIVRVPHTQGHELSQRIRDIMAERSAHKQEVTRAVIDPIDL